MNARTLITHGPGPMLEFVSEPTAEGLAELIAAFANSMGGTIVVGMDAKGKVQRDAGQD